jgi:hypothetical protein
MEPMSTVDPNHIHLVRVRLYKSNIEVNHQDEGLIQRIHHYSFSFNQKSFFDIERQLGLLNLEILLVGKDEDNEFLDVNGEFGIEFLFKIDNLSSLSKTDAAGSFIVNESLGLTLMAIAYSTARGIILQSTQGSMIEGVILPVIDPKDLLNDNSPADQEERDVQ